MMLDFLDRERWTIITVSATTCGALFLGLLFSTGQKRIASELTSLFHHVIVIILSLVTLSIHFDSIVADSALSVTSRFILANCIQWINIGYFLYDTVNAVVWEHNFIIHHCVALLGFGISDWSGRGGLGNAVNTLIAEVGSIFYNIYNKNKSTKNYITFVSVYGASRLVLIGWYALVLHQLWWDDVDESLVFLQIFISLFQTLLVVVNLHFLSIHLRKLRRILASSKSK